MTDPIPRLNAALSGRYTIERQLGEGGMASVYLAADLKHERNVALKVLKPELAAVVGAERFLAEIKTTANLQHPHILPLFDSGEADSFLFYVMPYIEGESLRDRLDREHQLAVDEAVRIATNVAQALDYAHRRGVIHRDIKPANILLHDGQPVISDFGIALAVTTGGAGRLTETGLSLGTPQYMSPEQATGDQSVGPATDVYALGCVLYEMLVGEPPYTGSTPQAILGKIIQAKPVAVTEARRTVPANVSAAIRKALEKVPADRFAGAADFARALGDAGFRYGEVSASDATALAVSAGPWKRVAVATTSLAAGFALAFAWALTRPDPPAPVERFTLNIDADGGLGVLPDGSGVVYGTGQLMLRRWDNLTPVPIPGTEGAGGWNAVSPSGNEVAFIANYELKVVSLVGGVVRSVATGVLCCPRWGTDGFIYYGPQGPPAIARVPQAGGAPESVVTAWSTNTVRMGDFQALPGQRGLVVAWRQSTARPLPGDLWAVEPSTGEAHVITPGIGGFVTPTGHLVFASTEGQILAAPFDMEAAELSGPAVPLVENVRITPGGYADFSLSESGTLVYWSGNTGAASDELFWVTRSGGIQGGVGEPFTRGRGLEISPDGTRVAYGRNSGSWDIWVQELPDGAASRLTLSEAPEYYPHWAPDSRSVTYARFSTQQPGDTTRVLSQAADGTGAPVVLTEGEITTTENFVEGVWAPNGEALVLRRLGSQVGLPESAMDLYVLRPGEGGPATPLVATADFAEQTPSISRDGRWLAYTSNETGRPEVFVRPFPDVNAGKWQISTGGGSHPVWAHNGRELFFYDQGTGELKVASYATTAATATTPPSFRRNEVTTLFIVPEGAYSLGTFWSFYDVAPDDERFLMMRPVGGGGELTAVVVKNFFEELKQKVPN